jgi:hypothetical protein
LEPGEVKKCGERGIVEKAHARGGKECRRSAREAVGVWGVGEALSPGPGEGRGLGRRPGGEGLGFVAALGLARCARRRGGSKRAFSFRVLDAEASFGRSCEFWRYVPVDPPRDEGRMAAQQFEGIYIGL